MKTEHTRGPWHVAYYGETERAVIKHGSDTIAQVEYVDDGDSNRITHANARLIAAAPDMLKACELALEIAESWIHDQLDGTSSLKSELARLKSVRAAITKATGK